MRGARCSAKAGNSHGHGANRDRMHVALVINLAGDLAFRFDMLYLASCLTKLEDVVVGLWISSLKDANLAGRRAALSIL